jgi:hypothetical protein
VTPPGGRDSLHDVVEMAAKIVGYGRLTEGLEMAIRGS